jgi:hypothetical protein
MHRCSKLSDTEGKKDARMAMTQSSPQHEDWGLVERENLIVHKNKTILVDDFSHLHGQEFVRVVLLHRESAIRRNKSNLLNLIDVTGSAADREVLAALKKTAQDTDKFYSKAAVIGLEGVSKYFLMIVNSVSNMGLQPFDTFPKAVDWLVQPTHQK